MKGLIVVLFLMPVLVSCVKEPQYEFPSELQFFEGTWKFNKSYLKFYNGFVENDYQVIHSELDDEYIIVISGNGKIEYFKNNIPVKTDYIEFKEIGYIIETDSFGVVTHYSFNQEYTSVGLSFDVTTTKDSIFDFKFPFDEGAHDSFHEYHRNLYTKDL